MSYLSRSTEEAQKFVGNEKLAKAFDELVPYLDKADSYAREAIDDVQASSSPAKGIFNKVWSMGKRFKASVVGVLEGMQADKELTKEDFLDLIKNDVVTDMAVVENFVEWGMKMGYHYVNRGRSLDISKGRRRFEKSSSTCARRRAQPKSATGLQRVVRKQRKEKSRKAQHKQGATVRRRERREKKDGRREKKAVQGRTGQD